MAKHVDRPIIFPLSNPTRLAECDPSTSFIVLSSPRLIENVGDANEWTAGKALIATGSPFPPVMSPNGKMYAIAEANNALIYPAFGLGFVLSLSLRVYLR